MIVIAGLSGCHTSRATTVGGYTVVAGGVILGAGVAGYKSGDTSGESPGSRAHVDLWVAVIGTGVVAIGVGTVVALVGLALPAPPANADAPTSSSSRAQRPIGGALGLDGLRINEYAGGKRSMLPAAFATINVTDRLGVDLSVGALGNSSTTSLISRVGARVFASDRQVRGFTGHDHLSAFAFTGAGFGFTDYHENGRRDLYFTAAGLGAELVTDSGISLWLEGGPALVRADPEEFPSPGATTSVGISVRAALGYRFCLGSR